MQKLNKEEEIMHILWKLKSVRKGDGGNNQTSRITTLCRPSCATLKKRIRAITPTGKRITTPSLLSRTTEKGL
jgi:hypothetical protein